MLYIVSVVNCMQCSPILSWGSLTSLHVFAQAPKPTALEIMSFCQFLRGRSLILWDCAYDF
jgi:hypothetical protein